MSPSIFSPNSHIRNSHYFPSRPDNYLPQPPPPPSSFSRSNATTVKKSLKKIPSAFFNKEDRQSTKRSNVKVPIFVDEPRPLRLTPVDHSRPVISSPRRITSTSTTTSASATLTSQAPSSEKDKGKDGKVKNKTKTRKALADILGWGNAHLSPNRKSSQSSRSKQPRPSAAAPPLPSKDTMNMPGILKKQTSRPLSEKSSQSGRSAYASLRLPMETPQTRARPSMGEDPFSRREEGAEVVDVVVRHGVASSVKSAARSDRSERRNSVASSKALSAKTLIGDEASVRGCESRPRGVTPPPTVTAFPVSSSTAQQRHISGPVPARAVLVDLPSRSESLGRVLDRSVQRPPPPASISSASPFTGALAEEKTVSAKTMRKEKTRSKIWGFFGGRPKNEIKISAPILNNPPTHDDRSVHLSVRIPTPTPSMISMRAATLRAQMVATSQPETVRSAGTIQPTVSSTRSSSVDATTSAVSGTRRTDRPLPPALHIQKPSSDMTKDHPLLTGTTLVSPLSGIPQEVHHPSRRAHPAQDHTVRSSSTGASRETSGTARFQSTEGPRQDIVELITHKGVPKRKSLTGLFGLAVKKSLDKIKPHRQPSDEQLRPTKKPSAVFNGNTLRSLAEELETAEICTKVVGSPASASPYRSRFGDGALRQDKDLLQSDADLKRVASATDKLSNLVCLDFSPANTASDMDIVSLAAPPSLTSLDGSPTPVRRMRSAVLTSKKSQSSPLREGTMISPLKLALHRAQVASKPNTPGSGIGVGISNDGFSSPLKTSMVRKGMRNVFAPPTPPQQPVFKANLLSPSSAAKVTDEGIGMGLTMGPDVVRERSIIHGQEEMDDDSDADDVPRDLSEMLVEEHISLPSSPSRCSTLGLPPLPPADRISPRRRVREYAPSPEQLPPVPTLPAQLALAYNKTQPNTSIPPRLQIIQPDDKNSEDANLSQFLSPVDIAQYRESFDFTSEYASLEQGSQRASFVEALAQIQSLQSQDLPELPPPPPVVQNGRLVKVGSEYSHSHSATDVSDALGPSISESDVSDDEDRDANAGSCTEDALENALDEEEEVSISVTQVNRTPRPAPFQGQAAFQKRVAENKSSPVKPTQPFNFSLPPPPPAPAPGGETAPTRRRGHRQRTDEAGFSIASMSSIGSVIETGIAGEYTNYFEVNFADHLNKQPANPFQAHKRGPSADSMIRHVRSRSHHRRNSSIASIDSIGEIDFGLTASITGPPVSMHNPKRSSYVSRHRRGGSGERASFGRSDWASHQRSSSVESTASSVISFTRLGRPGLGERMFQLDGGVQLTSITGSPPDDGHHGNAGIGHRRQWSYDSLLDDSKPAYDSIIDASANTTAVDSILDTTRGASDLSAMELDSVFGSEKIQGPKTFLLKGLRPDSMVSTTSTEGTAVNDTFELGRKRRPQVDMSPVPRGPATCLQGDGEDNTMTARQLSESANSGRQILNSSMSRPAKPKRRPANLVFSDAAIAQMETPALSSPSASETSSRLSLETKFSDAASVFTASRVRPIGAGHNHQKSSAGVKCHPTIKEEASLATLHNGGVRRIEPRVVGWEEEERPVETVRSWLEWKREADEEYRRTRDCWMDSEESKHAVEEFKMPTTTAEIAEFLAKSSAAYKPLEQLPTSKTAHRRKSSLSNTRNMFSPYGLPILPPVTTSSIFGSGSQSSGAKPKKASLQTKYERTNSATSSNFHWSDGPGSDSNARAQRISSGSVPPPSAVFAQFARELPVSPPPKLAQMAPFSPFQLPLDTFGLKDKITTKGGSTGSEQGEFSRVKAAAAAIEKRERVSSSARRQALGWGRRRNSDGPSRMEEILARQADDNLNPNGDLPMELREAISGSANQANQFDQATSILSAKSTNRTEATSERVALGARMGNQAIKRGHLVVFHGQENESQSRNPVPKSTAPNGRKAKRVISQTSALAQVQPSRGLRV